MKSTVICNLSRPVRDAALFNTFIPSVAGGELGYKGADSGLGHWSRLQEPPPQAWILPGAYRTARARRRDHQPRPPAGPSSRSIPCTIRRSTHRRQTCPRQSEAREWATGGYACCEGKPQHGPQYPQCRFRARLLGILYPWPPLRRSHRNGFRRTGRCWKPILDAHEDRRRCRLRTASGRGS